MKNDIHPTYYTEAKFKCACGKHWVGGATVPELSVDICSNCHPFYTGKQHNIDTRGRIEKFTKRRQKSEDAALKTSKTPRKTKASTPQA